MVTDVIPLLLLVTRILDDLGVPYVVGGSLASGIHGELRATNDVDILVDLPEDRVAELVKAMKPEFDIWEDTVRAAMAAGRSFGTLHVDWHTKVDFFVAGRSPLDVRELSRRVAVRLPAEPGREIYFASPEDTILRKLAWFQSSGGVLERQLRDVVGVLKLQGRDLDRDYLRSTADELHLTELLDRCLVDAGLED